MKNLLIHRRQKKERLIKLYQNNYRKLCNNEVIEGDLIVDYGFDFPSSFNTDNIKVKIINGKTELLLNYIPKWLQNITINGNFYCGNNKLLSLKGVPTNINGSFFCQNNYLTSLEYCPIIINGDFCCSYNHLTTLEHCPKIVNGMFDCQHNDKQFTIDEIKAICKVKRVINIREHILKTDKT